MTVVATTATHQPRTVEGYTHFIRSSPSEESDEFLLSMLLSEAQALVTSHMIRKSCIVKLCRKTLIHTCICSIRNVLLFVFMLHSYIHIIYADYIHKYIHFIHTWITFICQ